MNDLLMPLLTNPISMGIIVRFVQNFLQGMFQSVDDKGLAKEHKGWLEPTLMVLTVLTSAVSLALGGKLHELDVTNLVLWGQALVTQFYVSQGATSNTVKGLGAKTAELVKGK